MAAEIEFLPQGTVTSPEGFFAGATSAGINKKAADKLDLAVLFSEAPCLAAAVFTANKLKAAPVLLSQQRLENREKFSAVVVNSGCANAYVGEQGLIDAAEMAELVGAEHWRRARRRPCRQHRRYRRPPAYGEDKGQR